MKGRKGGGKRAIRGASKTNEFFPPLKSSFYTGIEPRRRISRWCQASAKSQTCKGPRNPCGEWDNISSGCGLEWKTALSHPLCSTCHVHLSASKFHLRQRSESWTAQSAQYLCKAPSSFEPGQWMEGGSRADHRVRSTLPGTRRWLACRFMGASEDYPSFDEAHRPRAFFWQVEKGPGRASRVGHAG